MVSDSNLASVTVNGEVVAGNNGGSGEGGSTGDGNTGDGAIEGGQVEITLPGNVDTEYVIVATDAAGNTATLTASMLEIQSLAEQLSDITLDTVTSANQETIQGYQANLENLQQGANTTEAEKASLQNLIDDAQGLLDRVSAAEQARNTANVQAVKDISADNVTFDNQAALEAAMADLENAVATYANETTSNYTSDERAQIDEALARINNALGVLQSVEAAENAIAALPDTVSPDDLEAEKQIDEAQALYDALSDYGKSLVSADAAEKLASLQAQLVDYQIKEGSGSTWIKGSEEGLTFVVNGAASKFTGIQIDGNEVSKDNYSVESGSTIITLNATYLNSLSAGEHVVVVNYTDGETEGSFTLAESPAVPADDVSTGPADNSGGSGSADSNASLTQTNDSNTILIIGLATLALGAAVCVLVAFHRIRRQR